MNLCEIQVEIVSLLLLATWLVAFHRSRRTRLSVSHQYCNLHVGGILVKQISRLAAIAPVMSPRDQNLFYYYLTGVNTYFEFGSGGSTAQAALRVSKIISVESDARWHTHLRKLMDFPGDIVWYTVDLKVPWNGWGTPGRDSPPSDWPNYTHAYASSFNADLILIDGRFRVSCALCVLSEITNRSVVMIHDFCVRRQYWVVLQWYHLIERGDTLVALRKREGIRPPSRDLIAWYDRQPHDRPMPGVVIPSLPKPLIGGE
jgi:hypothetical protein